MVLPADGAGWDDLMRLERPRQVISRRRATPQPLFKHHRAGQTNLSRAIKCLVILLRLSGTCLVSFAAILSRHLLLRVVQGC